MIVNKLVINYYYTLHELVPLTLTKMLDYAAFPEPHYFLAKKWLSNYMHACRAWKGWWWWGRMFPRWVLF